MTHARTIISTEKLTVATGAAVNSVTKPEPWSARVTADVDVFVKVGVGATAVNTDFVVFAKTEAVFSVGAGARVSVLGGAAGSAWVSDQG